MDSWEERLEEVKVNVFEAGADVLLTLVQSVTLLALVFPSARFHMQVEVIL